MDTWLILSNLESNGERTRTVQVLKSRGMAHSNQIREFLLTDHGIELLDVYLGPEGVLTGSARKSQEAREKAAALARQEEIEGKERELERRRDELEARIATMRREFAVQEEEAKKIVGQDKEHEELVRLNREQMATSRQADNGAQEIKPIRSRRVQGRKQVRIRG
jgi:circadian clock protein KaiC